MTPNTPADGEALYDDRTRPLLLQQAETRGAEDWRHEDAEAVIARLLAKIDSLSGALIPRPAEPAQAAQVDATDDATAFERADWFWRTMDPDDCGDSPEEAINRAMVGRFCVCEIASSYKGPTRYGFIAPVADPESDNEEFVHFATHPEAIDEARSRARIAAAQEGRG